MTHIGSLQRRLVAALSREPATARDLSQQLMIPVEQARNGLKRLRRRGLLSVVKRPARWRHPAEHVYSLAESLEAESQEVDADVLDSLRTLGPSTTEMLVVDTGRIHREVREALARLQALEQVGRATTRGRRWVAR